MKILFYCNIIIIIVYKNGNKYENSTYNCPTCGASIDINEKPNKCPYCGSFISYNVTDDQIAPAEQKKEPAEKNTSFAEELTKIQQEILCYKTGAITTFCSSFLLGSQAYNGMLRPEAYPILACNVGIAFLNLFGLGRAIKNKKKFEETQGNNEKCMKL